MRFGGIQRFASTIGASPASTTVGKYDDLICLDQSGDHNVYVYHISIYAAGFSPTDEGIFVEIRNTGTGGGSPDTVSKNLLSSSISSTPVTTLSVTYTDGVPTGNQIFYKTGALSYYNPSIVWDFPKGEEICLVGSNSTDNDDISISYRSQVAGIQIVANVFFYEGA